MYVYSTLKMCRTFYFNQYGVNHFILATCILFQLLHDSTENKMCCMIIVTTVVLI